jgi:hypothetical protein
MCRTSRFIADPPAFFAREDSGMYSASNPASGCRFRDTMARSAGILRSGDHRSIDWNEIGIRVAFGGALYPLALASCMLLASSSLIFWFGSATSAPWAEGTFIVLSVMLATGFSFVLFGCFLFSTLVAVPLVSIIAWISERAQVRISERWVTAVGVALVAIVWTLLIYCVTCWSPWT